MGAIGCLTFLTLQRTLAPEVRNNDDKEQQPEEEEENSNRKEIAGRTGEEVVALTTYIECKESSRT